MYIYIYVHISREYSQYWEKSLVQLILTTMAMGCGTSIFVDVSVAQLAKASMISWATRISAGPGSIPEFKLTYNYYITACGGGGGAYYVNCMCERASDHYEVGATYTFY